MQKSVHSETMISSEVTKLRIKVQLKCNKTQSEYIDRRKIFYSRCVKSTSRTDSIRARASGDDRRVNICAIATRGMPGVPGMARKSCRVSRVASATWAA